MTFSKKNHVAIIGLTLLWFWECNCIMYTKEHKNFTSPNRRVAHRHDKCSGNNDHICNITRMLSKLLKGYDKRLRPFLNEQKPVTIKCGFWILSIDSINVMDMDYRIDLFMRQTWVDPRLITGRYLYILSN